MAMTKVHSSSQRSMLAHMSSALKIEETELENWCSNLPLLEMDNCLPLLHLTCLFLVFLVKCCNGFSLRPTMSVCDGRLIASLPFCRLACRGALFRDFPFRWVLHFVLSLTRGVTVHETASCPREVSLYECGRPRDALSCFFSALWLRCNQSILVQETQSAKDIDMTCSKMFPIKATTYLQVGRVSLDWLVDPFARFDFPDLRCLLKFPATNNNEVLFQLPHVPVGDRMLFKHHRRYYSVLKVGMDVALSFVSKQKNREFKLKYL